MTAAEISRPWGASSLAKSLFANCAGLACFSVELNVDVPLSAKPIVLLEARVRSQLRFES
jgi:hypothetical protein